MEKSAYHFNFEDLIVYQKAMEFGEIVDKLLLKFPKHEMYKLTSQFGRAADSIALNTAEGSSGSDPQFHKHLGIAWFSANECVSCNTKARLRNYITFEEFEENRRLLTELTKMITTLRKKIYNRINDKQK
ncbi:MAG: four helix bundle protein [Flavobacteriaceae bacterium]